MADFRRGQVIPGYCGGIFDLDTQGDDLRVEAEGFDWLVLRDTRGRPHFYCGDLDRLAESARMEEEDRRGYVNDF